MNLVVARGEMVGVMMPALRASRVEPAEALRYQ